MGDARKVDGGVKIVAAAILFRGAVFSAPPPARHHHLIATIRRACELKGAITGEVQGFLTDGAVFVDRVEAGRIALEAGQLPTLPVPPDLYSEDLW